MRAAVPLCLLAWGSTVAPVSEASTFRISQLYSSLDGEVQYIELTESAGLNGQHRLNGLVLTSSSDLGVKTIVLGFDLPTDQTAYATIWISTDSCFWVNHDWVVLTCRRSDHALLPRRFLSIEGGTLDFAGIDRVAYPALPTDGIHSLSRFGSVMSATIPGSANSRTRFAFDPGNVLAIEYQHEDSNAYFISASAAEIERLDQGKYPGWFRTGEGFQVLAADRAGDSRPVCRYYSPPVAGATHFLSLLEEECAAMATRFPAAILESRAAFFAHPPDRASGVCHGRAPLYRLWDPRSGHHRLVKDPALRGRLVKQGQIAEGHGPDGVAMCVWSHPPPSHSSGQWDQ
jgi:hypothetical protein